MPTKVSRPGCEEDDKCYIPSQIVVEKGYEITWMNEDSAFHSVTSGFYDEPTGLFDSGYLDPYQSFSYTFDDVGVYDYYCTLHPWMEGQVIVE
jgi:plastocyanin